MPPTAGGLARAAKVRRDVIERNRLGVLRWRDHFPKSSRAEPELAVRAVPTFEEGARRYLGHCAASMSAGTLKGYRKKLAMWCRAIGHMPLDKIKRGDVLDVVAAAGWTGKTLSNALTPARGVFDLAIDDELIARNPASRIRAPGPQRPRPMPLTGEEVARALAACEAELPEWLAYWEVAIGTGMRPSEQIGLHWTSVDRTLQRTRVHEVRVENEDRSSTKVRREREVPWTGLARRGFQRQRAATELHSARVFLHPSTGEPIRDDQAPRRAWNAMLEAAGLPPRKAYSSRHTFACLHLAAGVPLTRVSDWMGHASPRVTLEHYAAWVPTDDSALDVGRAAALS